MKKLFSRRMFITTVGTGMLYGPSLWLPKRSHSASFPFGQVQKSRVVISRSQGILQPSNSLDQPRLDSLLDQAIRVLGNRKDANEVWKILFRSTDQVAIKVNTLGGRMLSPHPQLVYAIAKKLRQIGIPPKRILVWDRSEKELQKAGYSTADAQKKATLIATDTQGVGYERQPEISGTIGSCFSRILSQGCTALINVGVLKDHDLSGTSVAMKNLFGVIHNPNRYHFDVNKDPYLPDLCLHPYIKNKLRLNIVDAFRGQYDGGPAYHPKSTWPYEGLLVSTDPVALDAVAANILEKKRLEEGLLPFKEVEREPLYIQLAETKKVGRADPARIERQEVTV